METSPPPRPAIDLMPALYYQLIHTLTALLPPPLDDTPAALRARDLTAVAKVASLAPVNADEADIAAHCIAARAQAEDVLRLVHKHDHDSVLVAKLNRQYASMMRLWLAVHARLRRVQSERRKRDANPETANEDAWARYIAERSMLDVVLAQPGAEPAEPVRPHRAPVARPAVAPVARPAAVPATTVPEIATKSHNTAFETQMNALRPKARKRPTLHATLLGTTTLTPADYQTRLAVNGLVGAAMTAAADRMARLAAPGEYVSENKIDPHGVAFETWLSAETPSSPGDATLREIMREIMGMPLKGPKRGLGMLRHIL